MHYLLTNLFLCDIIKCNINNIGVKGNIDDDQFLIRQVS